MENHKLINSLRVLFGLLAATAIGTQLVDSINNGRNIIDFFSFFTIESNVLAVLILLAIGIYQLAGKTGRQIAFLRGAMTLYMTMTGIIYFLLLSSNEVALQTTIPWVNIVLHYIMPAVVLIDWLLFPPRFHTPFKKTWLWLIFPLAYLTYSLIRGAATGWYPYPFINPVTTGWPSVIAMSIIIASGTMLLAWLLTIRTLQSKPKRAM